MAGDDDVTVTLLGDGDDDVPIWRRRRIPPMTKER
jgi:hypothetical protein